MAEILLLRHSMTKGNLEGRYIGCRTDEPLCGEGILLLQGRSYPSVNRIYASPMKRCVETAQILWGACGIPMILVPALQECDFGDFENKNHRELNGTPSYQAWIDSGGTLPFPGGESTEGFKRRCQAGFAKIVRQIGELEAKAPGDVSMRIAVMVHGGTIMAILERYGFPEKDYFDYQVKNGCGYILTPVEGTDLWNYQYLP